MTVAQAQRRTIPCSSGIDRDCCVCGDDITEKRFKGENWMHFGSALICLSCRKAAPNLWWTAMNYIEAARCGRPGIDPEPLLQRIRLLRGLMP